MNTFIYWLLGAIFGLISGFMIGRDWNKMKLELREYYRNKYSRVR
jgi:hypothetical protein